VCRSGYYQLRQLRLLVSSMSTEVIKTLVQMFISCRLGPGLLQLSVLQHRRGSNKPAVVCSMRLYTFVVRSLTARPHHSRARGAALSSWSASGGRQDGHPGLPVTVQPICRRLSVGTSPTKVVVCCVLPHQGCMLSDGLTAIIFAAADETLWNSLPADWPQADINFYYLNDY